MSTNKSVTARAGRDAWGKNKTLASVLALLRDDRIPEHYFSDNWVGVCTDGESEVIHHEVIYRWGVRHERPWCVNGEWIGQLVKVTTSFDALVGMPLCKTCWTGRGLESVLGANRSGWRDGPLETLSTLWRVWDLKRQISTHEARLGGQGSTPGPRATARLLGQAESSAAYALAYVQRKHADLGDYAASLQEAAQQLRKASSASSEQNSVLCSQIRELVTPSWWEGGARVLDEREAVMVVYPVPRLTGRFSVAKQAFRVFAITENDQRGAAKAVLRGPRYVLDYLARLSGDPSNAYCVISDPGEDGAVVETAAALWEPTSAGELCDWPKAVETAVLLRGK